MDQAALTHIVAISCVHFGSLGSINCLTFVSNIFCCEEVKSYTSAALIDTEYKSYAAIDHTNISCYFCNAFRASVS